MTFCRLGYFKYIYVLLVVGCILLALVMYSSTGKPVIADDVEELNFSAESGFYEDEFDLYIDAVGGTVFYTLDGSTPTCQSNKYTGPIHISDASNNENVYSTRTDISSGFQKELIEEYSLFYEDSQYVIPDYSVDKCTVVRAVIYYGNDRYSKVKSASYFVGFDDKNGYDDINTVSIVTDPDNLFGYENGIYVTGKTFDEYFNTHLKDDSVFYQWWAWEGNYSLRGREQERTASIQFFDEKGRLKLSQMTGIRIHGGASRAFSQKSMNLYSREEYNGKDYFQNYLFDNDYLPHTVTINVCGEDAYSKMRDCLFNRLVRNLNVSTMNFEPYNLFLDGEYWGFGWITDKYDKEFVHNRYGIDTDNVIMIKNNVLSEGEDGDYELYSDMLDFCSNADMTDNNNFCIASQLIDMESYLDYYASMIYVARCGDWPQGNVALWRSRKIGNEKYCDGKWRWMVFDLYTTSMEEELADEDTINSAMNDSPMFANLMQNDMFRTAFLDKLLLLSDSTFNVDTVNREMKEIREILDVPMEKNIRRFYGENKNSFYLDEVESIENFFENRGNYIIDLVGDYR